MRTIASAGTLTAAVTAALLLAPTAYATAPGDNGTVEIHDAATGEELRKNEPHVCTFYLDAFGFDAEQDVDWRIEAWAPTAHVKGETVKSGSLTLDGKGHGRSQDQSLPDGHYKLFWNFDGEHGRAKHKVFWVDCGEESKPGGEKPGGEKPGGGKPSPSDTPSTSTSDTPAASVAPSTSATPSSPEQSTAGPASSAPEDAAPASPASGSSTSAPSSSPSTQSGGDLAETGNGAPVGLLSAAAAALVAAGGYLVIRRRKAQQRH
ncbi:LPXTG cell wall anchor domain-containing protein [Streptomyces sp. NPDC047515]|uniref:LPXTG cell wall anchor domain-containing protein n=1 Tax=Streptomyces sp. NPDC047515 TaxID=3155380 RepID=UPI0033DB3205